MAAGCGLDTAKNRLNKRNVSWTEQEPRFGNRRKDRFQTEIDKRFYRIDIDRPLNLSFSCIE